MKLLDLSYEKKLWKSGYMVVAGVDEVGRGCFAGPVCAAAVAFAPTQNLILNTKDIKINDSKKLSAKQREISALWIKKNALTWGIGEGSVGLINRIGIGKATEVAFRKAIAHANIKLNTKDSKQIDFLLIDAFYIPYVKGLRRKNQNAIVKGDTKSISIAAASIIAKVYRDKLMVNFSQKSRYKKYGWKRNKGYGTREHQTAILKYGLTRLHRRVFIETFLSRKS